MRIGELLFIFLAGWLPAFQFAFRLYERKANAGMPICFDRDRSIEELERYADFIITGTVERLLPSPNDYNLYIGVVRVRRVFKMNSNKKSLVVNPSNSNITVLNIGDPMICKTYVRPKDTKIFLLSSVSNYVSFDESTNSLVEFATLPRYVLNSSVIPLTLRNLDVVEAVVKDQPTVSENTSRLPSARLTRLLTLTVILLLVAVCGFLLAILLLRSRSLGWPAKIRKPLKPEACERKLCAFGAVCKINATTRRPYCDCPFNCDNTFAPVCGSDNVTYSNDCRLQYAACDSQQRIRVRLRSGCDAKNPCDAVECHFGAKCQVSVDGKFQMRELTPVWLVEINGNDTYVTLAACAYKCSPTPMPPIYPMIALQQNGHCVCPQKCYRYGDSQGSRPVCGDDGRTYESECHLQLESCRSNKDITIRYTGLCDPCANVSCPDSTVCKLNPMREPVCRCSEQCPLDHSPVCASDGLTYRNTCIMRIQACKLSRELRVVYNNACEKGKNPCHGLRCEYGQECFIDPFGHATCECLHRCEPVVRPVCGKDGVTYDNECELQKTACQKKIRNNVEHKGPCGVGACADHACTVPGTICVLRKGLPVCQCPACNDDFDPVCGSNGITYANECKMRQEACEMKRNIFVKYRGFCNGCKNKVCDNYAVCVADDKGEAACRCPVKEDCPKLHDFVCGIDGVTYENECYLKVSACERNEFIVPNTKGPCDACSGVECLWGARCENGRCVCPKHCPSAKEGDEVCGSDGLLYPSECLMLARACAKAMTMTVIERDRCSDEVVNVEQTGEFSTPGLVHDSALENGTSSSAITNSTFAPASGMAVAVDGVQRCQSRTCSFAGMCMDLNRDGVDECVCDFDICDELVAGRRRRHDRPSTDLDSRWQSLDEFADDQQEKKICGSDGRFYENSCLMDKESCVRQVPIYQEEVNFCEKEPTTREHRHRNWAHAADSVNGSCECNRIGAKSKECDNTGQCPCKPGVGGRKCDQCQPGFWGLQLISKGNTGCQPCGCSAFGSDRDDCEQTTGRCVCKPGVKSSMKCDECDAGFVLQPQGCVELSSVEQPKSCDDTHCYFGAKCQMQGGRPKCACPDHCAIPAPAYSGEEAKMEVCGSNGVNYGSACQLRQFACRWQMDVVVVSLGPCQLNGTKTWKPFKTTRDLVTSKSQDGYQHLLTTLAPARSDAAEAELIGSGEDRSEGNENAAVSKNDPVLGSVAIETIDSNGVDAGASSQLQLPGEEIRIGDACIEELDCTMLGNGVCVEHDSRKVCLCRRGYVPSQNHSYCVAVSNQIEPCAQQPYPCQNGGSCVDDDTRPVHGFRCICPRGYTGEQCEKKAEMPRFGGHSWMEFNRMDAYADVTIEIELLLHDTEGLVLYNGQKDDEMGDFISLALIGGFVEFRYNLGDGTVVLKSKDKAKTDTWHTIVANRVGQHGRLIVDKSGPVTTSPSTIIGANTHLNLRRNMFLGKVPHMPRYVAKTVGTSQAFSGCVLSLKINGKIYDLRQSVSVDVIKTHNVDTNKCSLGCLPIVSIHCTQPRQSILTVDAPRQQGECSVNPCSSLPCLNGGSCIQRSDTDYICICDPLFTGSSCETSADSCASQPCKYGGTCQPVPYASMPFTCICPQGRTGVYCENAQSESIDISAMPEFHGTGYLEMRPFPSESERVLSIVIWLMPYKPDGLLLFCGNINDIHGYGGGDFVSLALVDGRVQFLFNLGSGIANITSGASLEMGKWHTVKAYRNLRNGSLQVDQVDADLALSPPPWDKLNLESLPVFIGGTRNSKLLNSLVGVETGFYGAIQRISINGVVAENLIKEAVFTSGVARYEGPPCFPTPCRNGGTCVAKLEQFECACLAGYSGHRCEKETAQADIDEEGPAAFDGHTFLKYRNRVVHSLEGQRESSYVFRLRTNASDGMVLWENRGLTLRGDYLGIALSNGRAVVTFNLGKETAPLEMHSDKAVNDGDWHVVRFWRSKRQAYLSVDDDESPEMIISSPGATELNTDGYLLIGGSSRLPSGLPPSYYFGYVGCLDEVTVDGHRLHLMRHQVKPSRRRLTPCIA